MPVSEYETKHSYGVTVSPETLADALENPPEESVALGRAYRQKLKDAGGNHRQTNDTGHTSRYNPLTKSIMARTCSNCGSLKDPKPCAGCFGNYYCSRECQQADYPKHKKLCRQIRKQRAECGLDTASSDNFNYERWMNGFPGLPHHFKEIQKEGYLLPVLSIKLGASEDVAGICYGGFRTREEIAAAQEADPERAHMYRLDEEPNHPSLCRVVVQIERPGEKLYTSRVRVVIEKHGAQPTECGDGEGDDDSDSDDERVDAEGRLRDLTVRRYEQMTLKRGASHAQ